MWMMRRRIAYVSGGLLFLVLFALVVWQGSFSFGSYGPADIQQTVIVWAVSTLIFLLFVTLGFMLFRTTVKLYLDRQSHREGSLIRSKLIFGALALTLTPVLFSVLFSVYVLNRNLDKWFSQPARNIEDNLRQVEGAFRSATEERAEAKIAWLSLLSETRAAAQNRTANPIFFQQICRGNRISALSIRLADGGSTVVLCDSKAGTTQKAIDIETSIPDGGGSLGRLSA